MYYMQYLLQALVKRRPFKSADGVTAIEYALIAAIVALAIVTAATTIGTTLSNTFSNIAGHFRI